MTAFSLKIVSGGGTVYEGDCFSLVVPTAEGYYGIQAHHTPVVIAASAGKIKYTTAQGDLFFETDGAVVRFQNNTASILSRK